MKFIEFFLGNPSKFFSIDLIRKSKRCASLAMVCIGSRRCEAAEIGARPADFGSLASPLVTEPVSEEAIRGWRPIPSNNRPQWGHQTDDADEERGNAGPIGKSELGKRTVVSFPGELWKDGSRLGHPRSRETGDRDGGNRPPGNRLQTQTASRLGGRVQRDEKCLCSKNEVKYG